MNFKPGLGFKLHALTYLSLGAALQAIQLKPQLHFEFGKDFPNLNLKFEAILIEALAVPR